MMPGSSVAEQVTVNHLVVGSIPTRAAIFHQGDAGFLDFPEKSTVRFVGPSGAEFGFVRKGFLRGYEPTPSLNCDRNCVHLSPLPPLLKERGTSRCAPGSLRRTAPVRSGDGPVLAPPFSELPGRRWNGGRGADWMTG